MITLFHYAIAVLAGCGLGVAVGYGYRGKEEKALAASKAAFKAEVEKIQGKL